MVGITEFKGVDTTVRSRSVKIIRQHTQCHPPPHPTPGTYGKDDEGLWELHIQSLAGLQLSLGLPTQNQPMPPVLLADQDDRENMGHARSITVQWTLGWLPLHAFIYILFYARSTKVPLIPLKRPCKVINKRHLLPRDSDFYHIKLKG